MPVPNIPDWSMRDRESRALAVLDWCVEHGISTASIMGYQLDAAMKEVEAQVAEEDGVPSEPAPMDYVRMVRVLAAFLRSRI